MSAPFIEFVGPAHNLQIAGIKLLGFDAKNGDKLLFTLIFLLMIFGISALLRYIARKVGGARQRTAFWTGQGVSLVTFVLAVAGLLSIWFDNPARLATGLGLFSAGLAFALQQVVTSFAGYFVILRGQTFNVGDRIRMGGVRGM